MEGRIIKGIAGVYVVKVGNEYYKCKVKGKFRYDNLTPMIGDIVNIAIIDKDDAIIDKIYPRSSELIRPFVSNVTQAFVVFALKSPELNLRLLNKFLVLCESNNLNIVLCLNKMDLIDKDNHKDILSMLESMPYEVIYLDDKKVENIELLKEKIDNNISVFCGPSGVGKSTILNAIIGNNHMETGIISDKVKRGKHTTRHAELIDFENGFLVDTPGFSSIKIDFIQKENLQNYFPEIREYIGQCKFSNCMHYKEPGCAVKPIVGRDIPQLRYNAYIDILEELINLRRY